MRRNIIYLFALIFVIAGITLGVLTSAWLGLPILLIIMGIAIAFLNFSFVSKKKQKFWQNTATVASLNTVISTVAVLVIVGLINFIVNGYNWRFDLTEKKLFTLAPQSQEIVQNLDWR